MKSSLKAIVFLLCLPLISQAQVPEGHLADFDVVPHPRQCLYQKSRPFVLSSLAGIRYEGDEGMRRNAEFLASYLRLATGLSVPVLGKSDRSDKSDWSDFGKSGRFILLKLNKKIAHPEAYRLTVSEKAVTIEGGAPQGVFYGIQTLRKALQPAASASPTSPTSPTGPTGLTHDFVEILVPAVVMDDEPRFSYRGMHLDVSRHFYDVDFVKKYIDILALHHINTFHFHLTDDQGWRVEIKRYPKLTDVGAWRQRTVVGRNTGIYEWKRYGGFYTQEQLRDIVRYAKERYITVIPEIDMPGHMEAALAAYPELGCTGGPYEVEPNWGVFDDILCAGRDETFRFVEGVLDELMDIFPSEYIHIGGDEAPRTRWKVCPRCQQRIAQEHIAGKGRHTPEDGLQGYFMKRVEKYLNDHGRKAIGWDELLDCDVNPSTTIMSWRGVEGGIAASALGHDVIMVPTAWFYFDYYQTPENDYWNKPLLIGGYVPLEKVYSFDPLPDSLSVEARKHIIGLQANLWTEYTYADEMAEYQVLPRMGALAELQWSQPEGKDYDKFLVRQKRLCRLYDALGWKYCHYSVK